LAYNYLSKGVLKVCGCVDPPSNYKVYTPTASSVVSRELSCEELSQWVTEDEGDIHQGQTPAAGGDCKLQTLYITTRQLSIISVSRKAQLGLGRLL